MNAVERRQGYPAGLIRVDLRSSAVPTLLAALLALAPACAPSRPVATESPVVRPPAIAECRPETGNQKPNTDLYGDPLPPGAIARMGTVRFRHSDIVNSVAFSPDGKQLASGSADRTIRLWETATGRELLRFEGHRDNIHCVAFSPDGKTLASGSDDETIRLWEVATGRELLTLKEHHHLVSSVAFSPDGKLLASGSADKAIILWAVPSGKEVRRLIGPQGQVQVVAFSPDGKTLASGSIDEALRLWDVASGHERLTLEGHKLMVESLAFSPDGKTLASGSWNNNVRLWDVSTGTETRKFEAPRDRDNAIDDLDDLLGSNRAISIAFSPDGKTLASGGLDKTIRLWTVATGKLLLETDKPADGLRCMAFSPDGSTLASGGLRTIRLWAVATGKELFAQHGHCDAVTDISLSPDGSTLASGSEVEGGIRLWEPATGKERLRLEVPCGNVKVAFSPDGKTLASGGLEKTIRLWDVATGTETRKLEAPRDRGKASDDSFSDYVKSIAFSPDGKLLAAGGHDKTIRLWEAGAGTSRVFIKGGQIFTAVAFSPDGKILATGGTESNPRLWNVDLGKELLELAGHQSMINAVAFSPDGRALASGSMDQTIRLWDAASGKELFRLKGGRDRRPAPTGLLVMPAGVVHSVAFSPDGILLAAGCEDGSIGLWEVASGTRLHDLEGHGGGVTSLAFFRNGKRLVSGHSNTTALVWDVDSPVMNLRDSAKPLNALWDDLSRDDARRALAAVNALVERGNEGATALLGDRLRPRPLDADRSARIRRLVVDLDHDDIDVRDKASRALETTGYDSEPALQKAVDASTSPEFKAKAGQILERLHAPYPIPPGEPLRRWRAMQVLEQIGSTPAREVLAMLEKESPSLRERREAKAALERLSRAQH
jgi:WD40 repeat protein